MSSPLPPPLYTYSHENVVNVHKKDEAEEEDDEKVVGTHRVHNNTRDYKEPYMLPQVVVPDT